MRGIGDVDARLHHVVERHPDRPPAPPAPDRGRRASGGTRRLDAAPRRPARRGCTARFRHRGRRGRHGCSRRPSPRAARCRSCAASRRLQRQACTTPQFVVDLVEEAAGQADRDPGIRGSCVEVGIVRRRAGTPSGSGCAACRRGSRRAAGYSLVRNAASISEDIVASTRPPSSSCQSRAGLSTRRSVAFGSACCTNCSIVVPRLVPIVTPRWFSASQSRNFAALARAPAARRRCGPREW